MNPGREPGRQLLASTGGFSHDNQFEIWGSSNREPEAEIFTGLRHDSDSEGSQQEAGESSYIPRSSLRSLQPRRSSILEGQVVPPAPTSPVPRRSSLFGFNPADFADPNTTLPSAPTTPRKVIRRSQTASRTETVRSDDSNSKRMPTSPNGEQSVDDLEKELLRPSQPPTFYEKSNLDEEESHSEMSDSYSDGGESVDDEQWKREPKIATYYENDAILLDDAE